MTPPQIRVRVAEAMGWERNEKFTDLWYHKDSSLCEDGSYCDEDDLPNYPASLDACAEFEATLTPGESCLYAQELHKMFPTKFNYLETDFACITATPLQRCLAYLRTKGLATDEKEGT